MGRGHTSIKKSNINVLIRNKKEIRKETRIDRKKMLGRRGRRRGNCLVFIKVLRLRGLRVMRPPGESCFGRPRKVTFKPRLGR